ncbi:hypothetical protein JCM10449v2_002648 [Rhodotorula kratochvilovae]
MDSLDALLGSLPTGANPYAAVDAFLRHQVILDLPESFFVQLYALAGIMAFNVVGLLLNLALRVAFGRFWLARVEAGSIRPHGTQQWELTSSVFFTLGVVSIFVLEPYFRGTELLLSMTGLRTLIWVVPWVGGVLACHSLTSAFLTHLDAQGDYPSETLRRAQRILAYTSYATIIVFLATVVPFCVRAMHHWHSFVNAFQAVDGLLQARAATWAVKANAALNFSDVGVLVARLTEYEAELLQDLRILFALYAGWTALLAVAVDICAFLHIRSLRRLLANAHLLDLDETASKATARQTRAFRETYRTRFATVIAFTVTCLGFVAISLYIAVFPSRAFTDPYGLQAVTLASFYLYAVLGFPVVLLLLHRTLRAEQLARQRARLGGMSSSLSAPTSKSKAATATQPSGQAQRGRVRPKRGVRIGVETVVTVHDEREFDLDAKSPGGMGGEAFEMAPRVGTYAPHDAGRGEEKERERVRELYFLELEGRSREGKSGDEEL